MNLEALLDATSKVGASDLHLKLGAPPILRIDTQLRQVEHPLLTAEELQEAADTYVPQRQREQFEITGCTDFAYTTPAGGRFRVAVFHQRGAVSFAIRRINPNAPLLQDLNLPPAIANLLKLNRGFVLVTGVTGSGKSTTLAALIQEVNISRREHIVTIEDPIEYIFKDDRSVINQMEVGSDCDSFRGIMTHVVRFDPDIIMLGEMRSRDTVEAALAAADTGHLVLSTLHTSDAKQTINRILHFFNKDEEQLILEQLSLNLRAIISQRLLSRADVKGRVPAIELLINTPIVSKLIGEGRIAELQQALKNRDADMQTFDISIANLVRENRISMEVALKNCADESAMRRMIRGDFSADDKSGLIGGTR
jgi:twitching motility protein PilT